jgi:hypothetical protein
VTLRWGSPCFAEDAEAVSALWSNREISSALMIVGAGFDPRAAVAYELISRAASIPVDLLCCELPMPTQPEIHDLAVKSRERIENAAADADASIIEHDPGEDETALAIARSLFALNLFGGYAEIIVDVSAMPRGIYFPLIRGLIQLCDDRQWNGQLHVVATDNPAVDALVTGLGVETPRALPSFSDLDIEEPDTTIWVPVLGEGETARIDVLNEDIRAGEICPVLPFPAANPRRADNLIKEYRELLLDSDRVEPRNFIYAHESNPFDLYTTLSQLNADYAAALAPLGRTKMILSAHSSKLLSIGVLLTAFEQGLEVRHASPTTYGVSDIPALSGLEAHDHVVDLWLTGQPYE